MTQIKDKPETKPFPVKAVSACLLAELTSLAESEFALQGVTPPADPITLLTTKIRLDSLTVVDVTLALEDILGFEPKNIVKTGGYDSIQAALDHMMPRLEAAWKKTHPASA
ncbi:hypothetical protein A4249_05760 [Brevundimonas sp. GW460-12-10-14-LB2]|uniref:Acyl carrier protein n=2 Tax=Brevundimonas TaxID=41275 RepID=A0ABU4KQ88_BREVE|nr:MULTISPECIES: hypothetical protein [Brevundimonas]ANC53203.1 hypothetical protein A4249_05760 [Brevundimonas sp. GW460-12-10-14-LB2]MDX2335147.1 hypothetical protein [Brevundimonas vesicularis]QIH74325.1 hypothetical protein GYM46_16050 [Brevundimonas mediterranea]